MKRISAETTANGWRNRTVNETDLSRLPLSPEEIQEIRRAYQEGCQGEILIGMRGEERVVTMLLPAQSTPTAADALLQHSLDRLQSVGCDRCIRVRNDLVSSNDDAHGS